MALRDRDLPWPVTLRSQTCCGLDGLISGSGTRMVLRKGCIEGRYPQWALVSLNSPGRFHRPWANTTGPVDCIEPWEAEDGSP